MTRLPRILGALFFGVVLVGVVVLIVVEVAGYDGRTTAEVKGEERAEETAPSGRCPREPLADIEGGHDPGRRGKTVPTRPESALICGWAYGDRGVKLIRTERVLRRLSELAELTEALNALPPAFPWGEGEYACPEGESVHRLIGLRYRDVPEVQVEIAPGFCGGTAVLNLNEETEFGASNRLLRLLDTFLEG
jgi:hypothetical protein